MLYGMLSHTFWRCKFFVCSLSRRLHWGNRIGVYAPRKVIVCRMLVFKIMVRPVLKSSNWLSKTGAMQIKRASAAIITVLSRYDGFQQRATGVKHVLRAALFRFMQNRLSRRRFLT